MKSLIILNVMISFKRDSEILKICADTKKIRKNLKWKSNHSLKEITLKLLNKELY